MVIHNINSIYFLQIIVRKYTCVILTNPFNKPLCEIDMSNEITMRKAEKTDADFIFWIMKTAARSGMPKGFIDVLFPQDKQRNFDFVKTMMFSDIKSLFHYSNFIIAEADGIPVAGMSGYYTPEVNSDNFRACFIDAQDKLSLADEEKVAMGDRIGAFVGCFPGLLENAWVVEWVAAKPEFRGKGIINKLLKTIISQGLNETDCEVVQIALAKGNTPAKKAYTKAGFSFYDEKLSEDFKREFGYPGMERLTINR
ncbi:MAG: GNAT family N-acetyltransferase [Gammaproteobacteria bacterium]|nr:MAG: GNAT family N-acetyltransferase [Gammaproteobacteria bacterium]